MHLATIFRHTPQSCLLKAELLFDHTEGVFTFGPDVCLGRFDQIEQSAL